MKISELCRYALGICAITAILAGCGSQTPIGAPGVAPQMQTNRQTALGTAAEAPATNSHLYVANADGNTVTEVANTIHYPNGLTLSRDGKALLVAEMLAGRILSFALAADGTLGTRTVWARLRDRQSRR